MSIWLEKIGLVLASLAIPIAWGWIVNWLFNFYAQPKSKRSKKAKKRAKKQEHQEDHTFVDYQI